MAGNIWSLTLDVLKPHEPSIIALAERLAEVDGVSEVNINVLEVDANTETIKLSIAGECIDFSIIRAEIEEFGATVHSIDHVSVGKHAGLEGPTAEETA